MSRINKDSFDDRGRLYVKKITSGIETISNKVCEIIEVLKIGMIAYDFRNNDIGILITEVVDKLKRELEKSNIKVIVQGDMPNVLCDKKRMTDVFLNLFTNAIKFMGNNGRREIKAGCDKNGRYYKFIVEDTGIGIKENFHKQIFKIFNRLNDIEAKGTGVGLAIIKKIVEIHKGRVWVESPVEDGTGSRFCFTIPVLQGPCTGVVEQEVEQEYDEFTFLEQLQDDMEDDDEDEEEEEYEMDFDNVDDIDDDEHEEALKDEFVFRRNSGSWHIIFKGEILPATKHEIGLTYIAFLLYNPGIEIRAYNLSRMEKEGVLPEKWSSYCNMDDEELEEINMTIYRGNNIYRRRNKDYIEDIADLSNKELSVKKTLLERLRNKEETAFNNAKASIYQGKIDKISKVMADNNGGSQNSSLKTEEDTVINAINQGLEKIRQLNEPLHKHLEICIQREHKCLYDPLKEDEAIYWTP